MIRKSNRKSNTVDGYSVERIDGTYGLRSPAGRLVLKGNRKELENIRAAFLGVPVPHPEIVRI